jgi:hypothetical protein
MLRKYQVRLQGGNVLMSIDGLRKHCGFFTTRFVEATNQSEASEIALRHVEQEISNIAIAQDIIQPIIEVETVIELESFGRNSVPGSGYSWYEEQ